MVIGLIASPFVEVPPLRYGGTELFVANLAVGIKDANGESKLPVEVRWLYPQSASTFLSLAIRLHIHRGHDQALTEFYSYHPDVHFVTISNLQQRLEAMRSLQTIYHGIDLLHYQFREKKQRYLSFLGRIAPFKGAHLAIEIARNCGIPLKIPGEVQPMFQEYFDTQVRPHIDGMFIKYVGEAAQQGKNELLGNSLAVAVPHRVG